MAKKGRPTGQPNPAIRLSNLGPRLARLFSEQTDQLTLAPELDRLTEGLKPASFLPILVGTFAGAPEPQRALLAEPAGAWLRDHDLLNTLRELEARQSFAGSDRDIARSWIEAGGMEVAPEPTLDLEDLFIDAYEIGSESQASVTLFWYEDGRRRRVRVAAFLIDFEPPWEGALKDLAYSTFRDMHQAFDRFKQSWQEHQMQQRRVTKTYVTQRVWTALRQSHTHGIRLPSDFIAVSQEVLPFLFALPVADEGLILNEAEFETILTSGRDPDIIRSEERIFGYQMRMEDGSIARIMRPPEDDR